MMIAQIETKRLKEAIEHELKEAKENKSAAWLNKDDESIMYWKGKIDAFTWVLEKMDRYARGGE